MNKFSALIGLGLSIYLAGAFAHDKNYLMAVVMCGAAGLCWDLLRNH